jgi:hypothetical protein
VHIAAPFDTVARCVPRALGRLAPFDETSCTLSGSTDDPAWYAAQLAAIPAPFTLVGSDPVRAELLAIADRFRAACRDQGRADYPLTAPVVMPDVT